MSWPVVPPHTTGSVTGRDIACVFAPRLEQVQHLLNVHEISISAPLAKPACGEGSQACSCLPSCPRRAMPWIGPIEESEPNSEVIVTTLEGRRRKRYLRDTTPY
eukprot:scaffold71806_cov30-Tisochrysis_lutea.AAC.2